jgi:hypothetical protein
MGERNYHHLSKLQFYCLYGVVWTSSSLSIIGSILILQWIVRNYRRHHADRGPPPQPQRSRISVFHKLMFGLSLSDALYSMVMILQPFLIPSYTGLPVAIGNGRTCAYLGFGMMLVITSYLYSAAIALHFYLVVRYDNRHKHVLEPYCHIVPWLVALVFGGLGLSMQSFGYELLVGICLFGCGKYNHHHHDIDDDDDDGGSGTNSACDQGRFTPRAVTIIGWAFSAVALLAAGVGVLCTLMVYLHTHKIYRNSQRHVFPGSERTTSSSFRYAQKRAIASRSILYTAAFMNTFLVNLIGCLVTGQFQQDLYAGHDSPPVVFVTLLIMYGGFPIQGFWNSLVFFQPTVARWRASAPSQSLWWAIRQTIGTMDEPPHNGPGSSTIVRHGGVGASSGDLATPTSFLFSSSSLMRPSPQSVSRRGGSGESGAVGGVEPQEDDQQESISTTTNHRPGALLLRSDHSSDGPTQEEEEADASSSSCCPPTIQEVQTTSVDDDNDDHHSSNIDNDTAP